MIDALFRKKASALQNACVKLWEEVYGSIGTAMFLRCLSCHKLVAPNYILQHGRCPCKGKTYTETNLTIAEELYWIGRAIIWKVTKRS